MWFQKWGCRALVEAVVAHFSVTYTTVMLERFLGSKDEEINSNIFSYSLASSTVLSCMNFFLSSTASSVPVAGTNCRSDLLLY